MNADLYKIEVNLYAHPGKVTQLEADTLKTSLHQVFDGAIVVNPDPQITAKKPSRIVFMSFIFVGTVLSQGLLADQWSGGVFWGVLLCAVASLVEALVVGFLTGAEASVFKSLQEAKRGR